MQVFIWTAELFKTGHLDSEVKSKHKHLCVIVILTNILIALHVQLFLRLSEFVLSLGISSQ